MPHSMSPRCLKAHILRPPTCALMHQYSMHIARLAMAFKIFVFATVWTLAVNTLQPSHVQADEVLTNLSVEGSTCLHIRQVLLLQFGWFIKGTSQVEQCQLFILGDSIP